MSGLKCGRKLSRMAETLRKIMKSTRIVVGLTVMLLVLGPFIGLGHLSRDNLFFDDFERAGYVFPVLSEALLPYGPLWWWSYITPVALGVAVAGWVRMPIPAIGLVCILFASVMQFLTIMTVYRAYFYLTARMGNFIPIYPLIPLVANLCLVGTSLGLACYSLAKLIAAERSRGDLAKAGQPIPENL